MGLANRKRRRKFNGPRGRHSAICKKMYGKGKRMVWKRLQHISKVSNFVRSKPYRIVRRVSFLNNQPCTRITVQRLRCHDFKPLKHNIQSTDNLRQQFIPKPSQLPEGFRLVDFDNLQQQFSDMCRHVITCKMAAQFIAENETSIPPVRIRQEMNKYGLASVVVSACVCGHTFYMPTSKNVTLSDGKPTPEVNIRAVWGSMVTGSGLSKLNESFGTITVPGMSQSTYSKLEHCIGDLWSKCLEEDLVAAGMEEKRLAIERGDYHQGVPAVTVICDGGWSKRSHRHTYNALGGVGVIFGAETGKLLHIGVRNKHCYVCTLAETKETVPLEHQCFKNWTESSQAMEADIILEGFCQAESKHGVRYMRIIADGDSSVFSRIQTSVPVWGKDVVKLECANHACKCLRSNLEKLVVDKPQYKGKGKLTKSVRICLATAARCAIKMRSVDAKINKPAAIKQLDHDIRNSIHHIFGDHSRCSNFCKSSSDIPTINRDTSEDVDEEGDTFYNDQLSYWQNGTSDKDMEESRLRVPGTGYLDRDLLRDVSILLDRLANKSRQLIGNFTSNLAESWMSIRMKFDGGKTVNRCNRGSWHARCFGGALRKNFGPAWSPVVWQRLTGIRPGHAFTSIYGQRSRNHLQSRKSQEKLDVKGRARKRKLKTSVTASTKRARKEYGKEVEDVVPDVSLVMLQKRCQEFFKKRVELPSKELKSIEEETRKQSLNDRWKEERRVRVTASNFGEIVKKSTTRPVKQLVQRLLYSKFTGNRFTSYGLNEETATFKEYIQHQADNNGIQVAVHPMGLVIDQDNKHLAASTDGRVVCEDGSEGLLEVKNLLQTNQMTLQEASTKIKTFCLEKVSKSSQLRLKKDHKFYYQCQGQMNIIKMPWIDFVVRRTKPNQLYVERLYRDQSFWENNMVPKLTAFYNCAILPELAVPRKGLSPGIREPDKPWFVPSAVGTSRPKDQPKTRRNSRERQADTPVATCSKSDHDVPNRCLTGKRRRLTKFVGRKIQHQWCIDERSGQTKWYTGRVLDCLKGKDGQLNAIYEVQYEGEHDKFEVEHLQEDLDKGSLKFVDL